MVFRGRRTKLSRGAVIDLGPTSLTALVVAVGGTDGVPTPLKKLAATVAAADQDPSRLAAKLHELIFRIIRELGAVPEWMVAGIRPPLGAYTSARWHTTAREARRAPEPRKLRGFFENLNQQNQSENQTTLAYPLGVLINGYPWLSGIRVSTVEEIAFPTLLFTLPPTTAEDLFRIRQSVGGIPLEFLPVLLAYREVLVQSLGVAEAMLLEVAGSATTVASLRDGTISMVTTFTAQKPNDWFGKFLEALDPFYADGPLPPTLFLTGEPQRVEAASTNLRSQNWLSRFSYAPTPTLRILEGRSAFQGHTLGGSLGGVEEAGLGALLYYALHHESPF